MLIASANTLADVDDALINSVTNEEEDRYIRIELRRLCKALYGKQSDESKIKKNSPILENIAGFLEKRGENIAVGRGWSWRVVM